MVNFSELIKVKNNLDQINSPKTINQLFTTHVGYM